MAPVTALEFIQEDVLLSGEGPVLTVYYLKPQTCVSLSALQHQRIHGIRPRIAQQEEATKSTEERKCGPSPTFYDLAVFGGKAVRLVRLNINDPLHLENTGPIMELHDWALDVRWLSGNKQPLLCVALAHNSALLLDTETGTTLYQRSCSEGCLLYSALVLAHESWSDTVLIGGTVFNQLIIWKPGNVADDSESKAQVERRLVGHSGVIFSITYLKNEGITASASDDRSVRLWKTGNLGGNGGNCGDLNPICLNILYGHQARVFSVKLSCRKVFSAGEDGACLMWENGKVTQTLKGHRAGGVRALAISSESGGTEILVATGGADGAVRLWKLGMRRDKREADEEKLVDLKFPRDKREILESKKPATKRKNQSLKSESVKVKHSVDHSKPDIEYITNKMAEKPQMNENVERKQVENLNSQKTDDENVVEMQEKQTDPSFLVEKWVTKPKMEAENEYNMTAQETDKQKNELQMTTEAGELERKQLNEEDFESVEVANVKKHEAKDGINKAKNALVTKEKAKQRETDLDFVGVPKVVCSLEAENSAWSESRFVVCTDKGGVYEYSDEKWDLIWQGVLEFQSYCVMEVVSFKIKAELVHLCAVGNMNGSVQVFPIAKPENGKRLEAGSGKIHSLIWQKGRGTDGGVCLLASGSDGLVYRWWIQVKKSKCLELEVKQVAFFVLPTCAKRWLMAAVRVKLGKEIVWVCGDRRGSLLLYQESEKFEPQSGGKEGKVAAKKSSEGSEKLGGLAESDAKAIMVNQERGDGAKSEEENEREVLAASEGKLMAKLNQVKEKEKEKTQSSEVERKKPLSENEANEVVLKVSPGIAEVNKSNKEENQELANKPMANLNAVRSQENVQSKGEEICPEMSKLHPVLRRENDKTDINNLKRNQLFGEKDGTMQNKEFSEDKQRDRLMLNPVSVLFGVHGTQGVTSVFEHSGLFYSTGRDGCVRVFRICLKPPENQLKSDTKAEQNGQEFELKVLRVQRACKGMEWLEKVLILEMNNAQEVEEMRSNLNEDKELVEKEQLNVGNLDNTKQMEGQSREARFAIVGFHGVHFVVWDPVRQERLLSVVCGGGHRSWSLWTSKKGAWTGNGALVFIKQGAVLTSESPLMKNSGKMSWTLREGIHGRGIGCVCRLGRVLDGENGVWEVVVTGGEDTSVTVLALNPKSGGIKVLVVLTDHISSVRALTAVVNKDGDGKCLSALVVSAGGRAQMQCYRLLVGWDGRTMAPSCQVIQVAAHRLDEQWERKRNRHKMVKMDPETRYMSMVVVEETAGSLVLALACSDGAVRLFSVSESNHHMEVLWESFHHRRCVLSVATCCSEDRQGNRCKLLFSAATDGQVAVWDFTSLPSSSQTSPSPVFTFSAHQSGVNSLAVSPFKHDDFYRLTVTSGGDDGQLTVSNIRLQFHENGAESEFSVHLESQLSVPLAHAAPLTALKLLKENLIVSTSCDQRVCLWRVSSAGISHKRAVCAHVADAAALTVWEENEEKKCGSRCDERGSHLGGTERETDEELEENAAGEVQTERRCGADGETVKNGWVLVCGQGLQLIHVTDTVMD